MIEGRSAGTTPVHAPAGTPVHAPFREALLADAVPRSSR
jgi:hypothetical protein